MTENDYASLHKKLVWVVLGNDRHQFGYLEQEDETSILLRYVKRNGYSRVDKWQITKIFEMDERKEVKSNV